MPVIGKGQSDGEFAVRLRVWPGMPAVEVEQVLDALQRAHRDILKQTGLAVMAAQKKLAGRSNTAERQGPRGALCRLPDQVRRGNPPSGREAPAQSARQARG